MTRLASEADPLLRPDETADAALGGRVRLYQPVKGFRFSLDAVLLGRLAAESPVEGAVDLGCGCGVVALCLLALGAAERVVGVELQEDMVDRAARSAQSNGWSSRASFLRGDLREVRALLPAGRYPLVVSNPPYRPLVGGRVSPDRATALARHEVACVLGEVAAAAAYLLPARGAFCVVYPASRLAALSATCRTAGLEPRVLRLVHPRDGAPASLALLRCVKGSREGLEVRSPLFLHAPGRRYSAEAERLLGPP